MTHQKIVDSATMNLDNATMSAQSTEGIRSTSVAAVIVGQGKRLDYIDGHTQRPDTPEEYVRQEIAKSLVREYGYAKVDIELEFTVRMGTRKPRADIVVFAAGDAHRQDRVRLIVECKAPDVQAGDKKDGIGQLHSYMAACPNAIYGLWTNGRGGERLCATSGSIVMALCRSMRSSTSRWSDVMTLRKTGPSTTN